MKVAGVAAGEVTDLLINSHKRAVIKVELSGPVSVLGEGTICSSEPQSLIAEYFIDCTPKGDPIEQIDGSEDDHVEQPDIPVDQTRQTVQNDLVLSTMRLPFRERLTLLVNEFGTALAGNSENLNQAIRRGAPALRETQKVFDLLASQNTIIRDLNANSDVIIGKLADRRQDVVDFIEETKDTAEVSASRRDDLSQNFALLDDFLAELEPTMVELNDVAVEGTPLAANLRRAAPGLNQLSRNLPDFNPAATDALVSLGKTSVTGKRALDKSRDEIRILAKASKKSFSVADTLSNFLRDIDDPNRAVETDARANADTGRKGETGYTGMEGLLNYVYYQAGAINQYDEIGHLLHFSIFEVGTGPCSNYNPGRYDPDGPGPQEAGVGVPDATGDAATTNVLDANRCVAWLGPNQPGLNQAVDVPPYSPKACPEGSTDLAHLQPRWAGDDVRLRQDGQGERRRRLRRRDLPRRDRRRAAIPPAATPDRDRDRRRRPRTRARRRPPVPTRPCRPTRPSPAIPMAPASATRRHPRPDHGLPAPGRGRRQQRPPRIPLRELTMSAAIHIPTAARALDEPPPLAARRAGLVADDGRRDHDADRRRRRVPGLQRQQRPAVRAGLPRLGGRSQRLPARREQRGPDRRRARRSRRVDHPGPPRGLRRERAGEHRHRRRRRQAEPEAGRVGRRRCP